MTTLMGIRLFWDDDAEDVIHWEMEPLWDMQEVRDTNEKASRWFAERAELSIYVIVDLSASKSVPSRFMSSVASVSRNSPPNWIFTVIVAPDDTVRSLFTIGARLDALIANKYHLVETMADAYTLIADHRATHSSSDSFDTF